ncbi:MAG: radical SAM protein [Proteobacteria bacterium]|nr:radical SAM protein [Pseudomonadota bacterium]
MARDNEANLGYNIYVEKTALLYCKDYLERENFQYLVIDSEDDIGKDSKKNIIFKIKKGKFLEPCPGTPSYICCGYYVLSPAENCPFECTYCILQAYFKSKNIKVYANTEDLIKELNEIKTKPIFRIGTGEFSDSLFLPSTNFYLEKLLDFFNKNENIFLELKTKSDIIPEIVKKYPKRNVIISFSLNSPVITTQEEGKTASVEKRIESAFELSKIGFPLSFHFDPIIEYDGWEKDYKYTIDLLFEKIDEENIVWISLGILRFIPALKDIAENNYPFTMIFKREFITGIDSKKRYFRKKRVEIYKKMLSMIRNKSEKVFVYLCMENEDVWMDVFGTKMTGKKLKELMDKRIKEWKR